MDCSALAATGLVPTPLALVALLVLLVGGMLVVLARRRRSASALALIVIVLAVVWVGGPLHAPAAHAAAGGCAVDDPSGALAITQTSEITGLAPHRAPSDITGIVTNAETDDTFIVDVTVSILAVTKAPGASAGACGPSDYQVFAATMPVGESLAPGASALFSGASIGFVDKPTNQDACQGATITLLYSTG